MNPGYDEFPASAQQRALWFVETLAPGSARYHVPAEVRLHGELNVAALRTGLAAVVRRHEALRTGIVVVDGQPVQRVYPRVDVELPVVAAADPAAADALAREAALAPFALAEPPLLRARLIRLGPHEHRLVLVAHHLVCDAWSSGLLIRDLTRCCGGETLAPPAIQYADYAVWQAESLTAERVASQLTAWRDVLEPLPEPLALPVDRVRPVRRGDTGAVLAGRFAPDSAYAATPFAALVAALAIALGRLTGQDDLLLGAVAAHRDRPELAEVVGFLVNTVPVRISLAGDPSVGTVLERVQAALRDALHRIDLPFDRLVDAVRPPRHPGRLPLCDVLATWTPDLPETVTLAGATGTVHRLATGAAKADLTVEVAGAAMHAEYDRAVLAPATARWLVRALSFVVTVDRGTPISRLELVEPSEAQRLRGLGRGPVWHSTAGTVPDRFAEAARRYADLPAVDAPDGKRSYAELAQDVERCAAALRAAGVGPGDRVAVRTGRTVAWPVAMLGAMAAGAAVVPLDPAYPARRTEGMLADAGVATILDGLPTPATTAEPPAAVAPSDLAYLIYTSGSTGRPKGVAVEHASLVRLAEVSIAHFRLGPGDRVLRFASPAFDAAMWDLVLALLSGATLCLAEPERLAPGPILRDTLREQDISYVLVPPSALALVPHDQPLPALRVLVSGGEACPPALVERWRTGRRFVNAYGPTEATVCATWWEAGDSVVPGEAPPLGDALPGVHVYLLDRAMQPVPGGVPGEIYIGGSNLARGYWGRPDLTAQWFVTGGSGERLYRTGDRAIRREDGALMFCGRVDDQVKIRGFRVEPAEAQRVLATQPGISAAAVVPWQSADRVELAGYFTVQSGYTVDVQRLRTALRAELPDYLVPAYLVALDALPLTPNGKLDRAALPEPLVAPASRPPRAGLEQSIAQIWQDVLDCGPIGAEDNFFDVGGNSLALAQVHARLVELTGRDIGVVDLFTYPTIAALANHLSDPESGTEAGRAGRERAELRRAAAGTAEARRAARDRTRQP